MDTLGFINFLQNFDFHQIFHFYATFGRRDYEIRVARPDFLQNELVKINFRRFLESYRYFLEI